MDVDRLSVLIGCIALVNGLLIDRKGRSRTETLGSHFLVQTSQSRKDRATNKPEVTIDTLEIFDPKLGILT
ncbi:hypothetical protein [Allocoleopsis franciscana]|uniref:Uncharacterized protein n=1 Tax=Allocoleopsis franciscana PCC 7113 TaxID=1173027 RepID=K9WIQ8_9CYAN|nr:hypothetical protein [Allocoleopsis franciscana]AFZ20058.1 hypothetical protein Mic7113_4361 [Allocoleopsis franciscana PCC 7113]